MPYPTIDRAVYRWYIQYEIGLKIPEDVSIVGFDDIEMASWPFYSLTTVKQPVDEMMDCTVELLCSNLADPQGARQIKFFDAQLIRRGSVKISEKHSSAISPE